MPHNKSTLEEKKFNDSDRCYKMMDNHPYTPTTRLYKEKRKRNIGFTSLSVNSV